MAAYNKFNDFVNRLGRGVHKLHATGHTLKIYLSNTAPLATNSVKADIPEIAAGNGYTAGGKAISNDYTISGGTASLTGVDQTWTATGGSIGPFRYVILYNDTPATPTDEVTDPLIAWWDAGSAITLADGNSFTVDFGANIFTLS